MSTVQQRPVASLCGNIFDWRRKGYPTATLDPMVVRRSLAMRDFLEFNRSGNDPLVDILDTLSVATGKPAFIGDAS